MANRFSPSVVFDGLISLIKFKSKYNGMEDIKKNLQLLLIIISSTATSFHQAHIHQVII